MDLSTKVYSTNQQKYHNYQSNHTLEAGIILHKLHNTLTNKYDLRIYNDGNKNNDIYYNNCNNNNNINLMNTHLNMNNNNNNNNNNKNIDNTTMAYESEKKLSEEGKIWIDTVIDMEMINMQNLYQQEENQYIEKMLIEDPPIVSVRRNPRESEIKDPIQKQKAESCRRSRLNGKIKKAKTRFRHQFITEKLSKSANVLRCIYEVIGHAENKLIQGGFDRKSLDELKRGFGMNKNITELLNIETIFDNNCNNKSPAKQDKIY